MPPNDAVHLLWLDLETTGARTEDSIVEIACVLTDTDLHELDSFTSLVRPAEDNWRAMFAIEPVVAMHKANGLIDEIESGLRHNVLRSPVAVEATILEWLDNRGADSRRTFLAGSGVSHFDHRLLLHHMPKLASHCRYATLDVGVIRRAYELLLGAVVTTVNDNKTHRALDDVYCHLDEARIYRDLWAAHLDTDRQLTLKTTSLA